MKKLSALIFVTIVVAFWAGRLTAPLSEARADPGPQGWEHQCISTAFEGPLDTYAKKAGRQGWRLAGLSKTGVEAHVFACFTRPAK